MPSVIIWSVVMNLVMTIIMAGVYIAAIGDVENVLATPTGAPFIQVFFDVTRNRSAASAMAAVVIVEVDEPTVSSEVLD